MSVEQSTAARWLAVQLTHNGVEPVLIGDTVHRWDGCVWQPVTRRDFYQRLTNPANPVVMATSETSIAGTIKILNNIVALGGSASRGVPCRNGFVEIDMSSGAVRLVPHNPSQYQTWMLDLGYSPRVAAPLWRQTLRDVLDPSCIPTLQEAFGAALMAIGPLFERAFALPGHGENGRSTILSVLRALFDARVVKSIPPQAWSRDFQLAELAGARVNIVAEMPSREILDSEKFKAMITGRDLIVAEKKYKDPFGFVPIATHFFAPNELPVVVDQTHGFWRRWIVIPFTKRITKPDRERDKKIIENELPGVLAWAIEGARRLVKNGDYTIAPAIAEKKQEWRLQVDHVLRFIEEKCERLFIERAGEKIASSVNGDRAEDVQRALHYYLSDQRVNSISVPKAGERLKAILGPKGEGWDRDEHGIKYAIKIDPAYKALAQLLDETRGKKGGL